MTIRPAKELPDDGIEAWVMSDIFDFDAEYGRLYDQFIRQIIPGYDSFFALEESLISNAVGDIGKVLVAGCGSGTELMRFAQGNPRWLLTGVDRSLAMLEHCRRRLETCEMESPVQLLLGCIPQLEFAGNFDGVTSNLVMHFIQTKVDKLNYLCWVRSKMRSGGVMVLMDACWEKEDAFASMMRAWWDYARRSGLSRERWQTFREEFEKGIFPLTRQEELSLIEEAGFMKVCSAWSCLHHQAFVGVNP